MGIALQSFKRIFLGIVLFWLLLTILPVLLYKFLPVIWTPLMSIRQSENPKLQIRQEWKPIEQISPRLVLAVLTAEDQRFMDHPGFDLIAIQRAIQINRQSKHKIGASTISQQVAKNVFLWPDRTWLRKGLEVYFTILIELFWSKERIMEVYLNVAEWGNGIFGAEAAAQYAFVKHAKNLSRSESAILAAVLPNPRKHSARNPDQYTLARANALLAIMDTIELPQEFSQFSQKIKN
ncbi:MAG: monofunctional biosynthetic peptidoglycan transglycosylase [Bacteroidia bacterium]|nr:monofunctional biosynthetic peptidoglycan transglycosylase [Bacteroidia bacterium]